MSLAKGYDFIPEEHIGKKGSHCYNAHMVKTFYCDASRVLHHPAALGEEDFGDCYDRAAHPITSLSVQAWGVPPLGCRLLFHLLTPYEVFPSYWFW